MKSLFVERPKEKEEEYPWDEGVIRRFKLDDDEVERLEEGLIVWRGETAFSLETSTK